MIDIALNLASGQFEKDRDEVITRAREAGVDRFLLLASEVAEARRLTAMTARYPECFSTVGCHPHQAELFDNDSLSIISELINSEKVVAVGECGLDYNRNYSPRDVQRQVFISQLDLAATLRKPVLLHERDAYDEFMAILEPRLTALPAAVLHCFTGSEQSLERYLEAGLYIGITGWICDERRGKALRELVKLIPADRLFLETDAPYLLPRDLPNKPKSRRNEPCYLPHIYEVVAQLRQVSVNELKAQIRDNFQRVFLS
ncbi:TatD family hydrolase [Celerinatantimonas diazotrophica]|uniref:TatD DNase family protein n=1 Tax=Celerinatantimonas diazotrophica TaxID=412034 RepID=A0A4R1KF39_9GAMM|nr:TatD family hydrolase [Celerinatantimonas diazotrophica]TCK63358.1 TatD DNase family protein [Celerinatantimonas diazotrophica]CAG9294902.1 3'-5' ssDNA/RNA exonuclease TatD [Celerinatantimonas diazotrophica]